MLSLWLYCWRWLSFFCMILLLTLPSLCYTPLSDYDLKRIPFEPSDFDPFADGTILSSFLVPRVPESSGSNAVQSHIATFFKNNLPEWNLEFHNFTAENVATRNQTVSFANIVATRGPPEMKHRPGDVARLVLAAHYDSKLHPDGFIGATDSAVSCAMMLQIARAIDHALRKKWEAANKLNVHMEDMFAIQVIFFDGEEQFRGGWNNYDGFYGSRNLARSWEGVKYPASAKYTDALAAIRLFVLLDLLGSDEPMIPSYFSSTRAEYLALATLERRFARLGLFRSNQHPFLVQDKGGNARMGQTLLEQDVKALNIPPPTGIQDDHTAFLERGVNVLHLIPSPFPKVWHTMNDDAAHINLENTEDWTRILTAFVMEQLDIGFNET